MQRLRNRVYPKTLHELKQINKLNQSGLNVPSVATHLKNGACSALATQAIEPVRELYEIEKPDQARIMLEMAYQLLSKGFIHKDMHAGNILLDTSDTPFLVDCYEIKQVSEPSGKQIIAMFGQIVSLYNIPDEILHRYLAKLLPGSDYEKMISTTRKLAKKFKRSRINRWIKRSLRNGSFSRKVSTPESTAWINRKHDIDVLELIRQHKENLNNNHNILKKQEKTQLSLVGKCCIKSYKTPRLLRKPYAIRAWKGLLRLYFNDYLVPDPVAVIVFRDKSSALITKALDLPSLDKLLYHDDKTLQTSAKHRLAGSLGAMIGQMHAWGIYHADLKACNILVEIKEGKLYLLDTDRVIGQTSLNRRRRIKNLVQINNSIPKKISRTLRMRFLNSYAKITQDDAKKLFRMVWNTARGMEIVFTTDFGDQVDHWDQKS